MTESVVLRRTCSLSCPYNSSINCRPPQEAENNKGTDCQRGPSMVSLFHQHLQKESKKRAGLESDTPVRNDT